MRTADRLTLGERAAERLRNRMGSWTFVVWPLGGICADLTILTRLACALSAARAGAIPLAA